MRLIHIAGYALTKEGHKLFQVDGIKFICIIWVTLENGMLGSRVVFRSDKFKMLKSIEHECNEIS